MEARHRLDGSTGFGTLLRSHRLAAGLSQEALAERARMSVEGISALERGLRRTPQRETLGLLAGALSLGGQQRRAFEEAAGAGSRSRRQGLATVGPWPSSSTAIVPPPLAIFVGRQSELSAVQTALESAGSIAAVHGLGGVGKSSLAREYAWRNPDRYSVVWWLNAQTEDGIIDGLLGLGGTFIKGLDQRADRRAAAQQVANSVQSRFEKPVLLVFDNLEDEQHLQAWLPRSGTRALITSRSAEWSETITAIPLRTWPLETATEYLQRESGRTNLSEADARAIAETLGGLPLALAHAAALLRNMRMLKPERYLTHIATRLQNAPRESEYPQSVFATFKTAIVHAESDTPGAIAILCFAASFAPDAIPDELFRQRVENYADGLRAPTSEDGALDLRSVVADEVRLDEALGTLDRLSLLVYSEDSETYAIHRLVQLAAQDLVSSSSRAWRECAIAVLDSAFPDVKFATWPQCARLLPHARAALDALPYDRSVTTGRVAYRCAVYLSERGEYGAAEALQARALSIREHSLGFNHPEVALSLTALGSVIGDQGRYLEAETLHLRALAIQEKVLGTEHPDVVRSLENLARLYSEQSRFREAETLYKRNLATAEKTIGPEHRDVARNLNNLGVVYYLQDRFEEAELLYRRALAILEKELGPDHPNVAKGLNNIASACNEQGRYREADQLRTRALAIFEKALGPEHPDVSAILENVAETCSKQKDYDKAEALFMRAFRNVEKAGGANHPSFAMNLIKLANMYCEQGRYEEAEPVFARATAILEKALGLDHPDVATSLFDFANLYEAQRRGKDAEALIARALAIREKTLGAGHAATQRVRDRLKELRSM